MASFTRLKYEPGQPWGIRVYADEGRPDPGDTVKVRKRNGEVQEVVVGAMVKDWGDAVTYRIAPQRREAGEQEFAGNGQVAVSEPGVYELDDGAIYVVKPSKNREGAFYAARVVKLTEGEADRVNDQGEAVRIRLEYERGAIYRIRPEHRMPFEKAKGISQSYRHCICCGMRLEVKESIDRGIGPVCAKKYFAPKAVAP